MDRGHRVLTVDFDKIEKDKGGDPNLNEEICVKSAVLNAKDPMKSDPNNFRMSREKGLKALQRHTFRHEVALFFEILYQSKSYDTRNAAYWSRDTFLKLLKKKGGESCIVGSRNLQLILNLRNE